MHLRLSITKPYFIRPVSTRNSQSYLCPLESAVTCWVASLIRSPQRTRRYTRVKSRRIAFVDLRVNALDLIIDIFNDPLQLCRQRLSPARPLQLPHSFR